MLSRAVHPEPKGTVAESSRSQILVAEYLLINRPVKPWQQVPVSVSARRLSSRDSAGMTTWRESRPGGQVERNQRGPGHRLWELEWVNRVLEMELMFLKISRVLREGADATYIPTWHSRRLHFEFS